jgi:chemotaxis receptor (MCP) glutamine deamidase CheD
MSEDHDGKVAVAEYFLRPGFIYVPAIPTLISVVLGSAVSVCVYDKKNGVDVGRENVEMARRALRGSRIGIVSEDVGGQRGRKVIFHCGKFESVVLKVERLRKGDWYPYESDR